MSSLRVESLRLCWLEAFVALGSEENFSGAARTLGVSQPTVSRYVQALEEWAGSELVEAGAIKDPDIRKSIGLTAAGHSLCDIAERFLGELAEFSTEKVRKIRIINELKDIVDKFESELTIRNRLKIVILLKDKFSEFREVIDSFIESTPIEFLEEYRASLRRYFSKYEIDRNREKKRKRVKATRFVGNLDFLDNLNHPTEKAAT